MKNIFRILGVALLASSMLFVGCKKDDPDGPGNGGDIIGDITDATSLEDVISENRTLPDLGLDVDYIVDGCLNIRGNALLTIEPGVTIMFTGTDGCVVVGENAGLKMVGTPEKHIRFVGPTNNPNNGSWGYIKYLSNRSDNQMEYVDMIRGGEGDDDWEGVLRNYGKLSMKNCLIDGSLFNGIDIDHEGYFTAFENNTIKNCAKYPIYNENGLAQIVNFGQNTYVGNSKNYVFIQGAPITCDDDYTLPRLSIPYLFKNGIVVDGTGTFSIEPGVNMLFDVNTTFDVASEVALNAVGTAEAPILMTSLRGEPGDWYGIDNHSTRAATKMFYCKVSNAGAEDGWRGGCLYIRYNSKITLENCEFGPSAYYGVSIENISNFANVHHTGVTFVNCAAGNVYIEGDGSYGGTDYESDSVIDDLP